MEMIPPEDARERHIVFTTLALFDYAGRTGFAKGEEETLRDFYCLAHAMLVRFPHGTSRELVLATLLDAQKIATRAFAFLPTREEN